MYILWFVLQYKKYYTPLDTASLSHPAHHNSSLSTNGGRSSGCPHPDEIDTSGQHPGDADVGPHEEGEESDTFLHESSSELLSLLSLTTMVALTVKFVLWGGR